MILLGVNQTLQLQGPAFHCQLRRKRLFWVASLLFVFLVLLEQAYLLNSPNVVNCNDNLSSSDKSHSALRTTWRYDHQHYWHISKVITSRSFKSFPRWELLGEATTVWEGGVLDLCASVGLCQNVGGDDDYIWTMIIMMWMIDLEDDLFRFFSSWEESTLTPTLFWPKSFHWAAWRMPSAMKCMMVWAHSHKLSYLLNISL